MNEAADVVGESRPICRVFGRAPDYDTATDHLVLSAVAEVRKRLAQYYQEQADGSRIRIEIQPGSYVPQFRRTADHPELKRVTPSTPIELPPEPPTRSAEPSRPLVVTVLGTCVPGNFGPPW